MPSDESDIEALTPHQSPVKRHRFIKKRQLNQKGSFYSQQTINILSLLKCDESFFEMVDEHPKCSNFSVLGETIERYSMMVGTSIDMNIWITEIEKLVISLPMIIHKKRKIIKLIEIALKKEDSEDFLFLAYESIIALTKDLNFATMKLPLYCDLLRALINSLYYPLLYSSKQQKSVTIQEAFQLITKGLKTLIAMVRFLPQNVASDKPLISLLIELYTNHKEVIVKTVAMALIVEQPFNLSLAEVEKSEENIVLGTLLLLSKLRPLPWLPNILSLTSDDNVYQYTFSESLLFDSFSLLLHWKLFINPIPKIQFGILNHLYERKVSTFLPSIEDIISYINRLMVAPEKIISLLISFLSKIQSNYSLIDTICQKLDILEDKNSIAELLGSHMPLDESVQVLKNHLPDPYEIQGCTFWKSFFSTFSTSCLIVDNKAITKAFITKYYSIFLKDELFKSEDLYWSQLAITSKNPLLIGAIGMGFSLIKEQILQRIFLNPNSSNTAILISILEIAYSNNFFLSWEELLKDQNFIKLGDLKSLPTQILCLASHSIVSEEFHLELIALLFERLKSITLSYPELDLIITNINDLKAQPFIETDKIAVYTLLKAISRSLKISKHYSPSFCPSLIATWCYSSSEDIRKAAASCLIVDSLTNAIELEVSLLTVRQKLLLFEKAISHGKKHPLLFDVILGTILWTPFRPFQEGLLPLARKVMEVIPQDSWISWKAAFSQTITTTVSKNHQIPLTLLITLLATKNCMCLIPDIPLLERLFVASWRGHPILPKGLILPLLDAFILVPRSTPLFIEEILVMELLSSPDANVQTKSLDVLAIRNSSILSIKAIANGGKGFGGEWRDSLHHILATEKDKKDPDSISQNALISLLFGRITSFSRLHSSNQAENRNIIIAAIVSYLPPDPYWNMLLERACRPFDKTFSTSHVIGFLNVAEGLQSQAGYAIPSSIAAIMIQTLLFIAEKQKSFQFEHENLTTNDQLNIDEGIPSKEGLDIEKVESLNEKIDDVNEENCSTQNESRILNRLVRLMSQLITKIEDKAAVELILDSQTFTSFFFSLPLSSKCIELAIALISIPQIISDKAASIVENWLLHRLDTISRDMMSDLESFSDKLLVPLLSIRKSDIICERISTMLITFLPTCSIQYAISLQNIIKTILPLVSWDTSDKILDILWTIIHAESILKFRTGGVTYSEELIKLFPEKIIFKRIEEEPSVRAQIALGMLLGTSSLCISFSIPWVEDSRSLSSHFAMLNTLHSDIFSARPVLAKIRDLALRALDPSYCSISTVYVGSELAASLIVSAIINGLRRKFVAVEGASQGCLFSDVLEMLSMIFTSIKCEGEASRLLAPYLVTFWRFLSSSTSTCPLAALGDVQFSVRQRALTRLKRMLEKEPISHSFSQDVVTMWLSPLASTYLIPEIRRGTSSAYASVQEAAVELWIAIHRIYALNFKIQPSPKTTIKALITACSSPSSVSLPKSSWFPSTAIKTTPRLAERLLAALLEMLVSSLESSSSKLKDDGEISSKNDLEEVPAKDKKSQIDHTFNTLQNVPQNTLLSIIPTIRLVETKDLADTVAILSLRPQDGIRMGLGKALIHYLAISSNHHLILSSLSSLVSGLKHRDGRIRSDVRELLMEAVKCSPSIFSELLCLIHNVVMPSSAERFFSRGIENISEVCTNPSNYHGGFLRHVTSFTLGMFLDHVPSTVQLSTVHRMVWILAEAAYGPIAAEKSAVEWVQKAIEVRQQRVPKAFGALCRHVSIQTVIHDLLGSLQPLFELDAIATSAILSRIAAALRTHPEILAKNEKAILTIIHFAYSALCKQDKMSLISFAIRLLSSLADDALPVTLTLEHTSNEKEEGEIPTFLVLAPSLVSIIQRGLSSHHHDAIDDSITASSFRILARLYSRFSRLDALSKENHESGTSLMASITTRAIRFVIREEPEDVSSTLVTSSFTFLTSVIGDKRLLPDGMLSGLIASPRFTDNTLFTKMLEITAGASALGPFLRRFFSTRHIALPEVYKLTDLLFERMLHSSGEGVRSTACNALSAFFGSYPLSKSRFHQWFNLLIAQLDHPWEEARFSVLSLLSSLREEICNDDYFVDLLILKLLLVSCQDVSENAKTAASKLLKELLDKRAISSLLGHCLLWLDPKLASSYHLIAVEAINICCQCTAPLSLFSYMDSSLINGLIEAINMLKANVEDAFLSRSLDEASIAIK